MLEVPEGIPLYFLLQSCRQALVAPALFFHVKIWLPARDKIAQRARVTVKYVTAMTRIRQARFGLSDNYGIKPPALTNTISFRHLYAC